MSERKRVALADGQNQGRKVEDGESGFFHRGFALDCVIRSGVGREHWGGEFQICQCTQSL